MSVIQNSFKSATTWDDFSSDDFRKKVKQTREIPYSPIEQEEGWSLENFFSNSDQLDGDIDFEFTKEDFQRFTEKVKTVVQEVKKSSTNRREKLLVTRWSELVYMLGSLLTSTGLQTLKTSTDSLEIKISNDINSLARENWAEAQILRSLRSSVKELQAIVDRGINGINNGTMSRDQVISQIAVQFRLIFTETYFDSFVRKTLDLSRGVEKRFKPVQTSQLNWDELFENVNLIQQRNPRFKSNVDSEIGEYLSSLKSLDSKDTLEITRSMTNFWNGFGFKLPELESASIRNNKAFEKKETAHQNKILKEITEQFKAFAPALKITEKEAEKEADKIGILLLEEKVSAAYVVLSNLEQQFIRNNALKEIKDGEEKLALIKDDPKSKLKKLKEKRSYLLLKLTELREHVSSKHSKQHKSDIYLSQSNFIRWFKELLEKYNYVRKDFADSVLRGILSIEKVPEEETMNKIKEKQQKAIKFLEGKISNFEIEIEKLRKKTEPLEAKVQTYNAAISELEILQEELTQEPSNVKVQNKIQNLQSKVNELEPIVKKYDLIISKIETLKDQRLNNEKIKEKVIDYSEQGSFQTGVEEYLGSDSKMEKPFQEIKRLSREIELLDSKIKKFTTPKSKEFEKFERTIITKISEFKELLKEDNAFKNLKKTIERKIYDIIAQALEKYNLTTAKRSAVIRFGSNSTPIFNFLQLSS